MTTVLGDKLTEALNNKSENLYSYIWKGAKEVVNGEKVQTEIRLMDATSEQLNKFYQHCKSMLNNTDKTNPGRYTLLNIIKDQRTKCNAELYLRYLEDGNPENGRVRYPRFSYLQDLREFLRNNKEIFPQESLKTTLITEATSGIPEEFTNLTIDMVLDACLDTLGFFEKKHLTLNFIVKLGLWFDPQELKDLTEKDSENNTRDRLAVIKERLDLKNVNLTFNPMCPKEPYLKIDPRGLSYKEFRAMVSLKSKKYSALTTDQLLILRNKVLFRLEEEVVFHISQWETRMNQIEKVADAKGFHLD